MCRGMQWQLRNRGWRGGKLDVQYGGGLRARRWGNIARVGDGSSSGGGRREYTAIIGHAKWVRHLEGSRIHRAFLHLSDAKVLSGELLGDVHRLTLDGEQDGVAALWLGAGGTSGDGIRIRGLSTRHPWYQIGRALPVA